MIKERFSRNKPHCNIGTIAHVDYGNTALTASVIKILEMQALSETQAERDARMRGNE